MLFYVTDVLRKVTGVQQAKGGMLCHKLPSISLLGFEPIFITFVTSN